MVVDNLYLMSHHFPVIVIVIFFFFIYEGYLIPIKCYTGETDGDPIVTIFELYMSV